MKTEMKKALMNKSAIVTYTAAVLLAVWHAVIVINRYYRFYHALEAGKIEGNPMITSASLFGCWLGADVTSFAGNVFFFLLPVLAVLPYGWSLAGEMRLGYTKNILCRISRKEYFLSKYTAVFTSGALAAAVPLLVNFLLLSLFVPALKMENIYPYGILGQKSMWSGIYYEAPFLYSFLYILLDAVYAGLIASISTAASFFIRNRVTVLLAPFFIMLITDYLDTNFSVGWELSPVKFLHALPVANDRLGWWILLLGGVLLVGTLGTLLCKEVKHEVL